MLNPPLNKAVAEHMRPQICMPPLDACQISAPHGAKQPVGMVADLTRSCWRRGRGRIDVLSFDAVGYAWRGVGQA